MPAAAGAPASAEGPAPARNGRRRAALKGRHRAPGARSARAPDPARRSMTRPQDRHEAIAFAEASRPCQGKRGGASPPSGAHPMSDDPLSRLLASRDWLLADGATGTTLFNMGLQSGDAPELWNADAAGRIATLYAGAVEAGSDLFLTNTFGGTAARLKLHDAQGRVRELNRLGAEIGREVADKAGRPVIVAGSMGPTGEIMAPLGPLTESAAVEMFHEQAEGLRDGGADVLWVETISAPEEYRAAGEAARRAGMPWCGTMSFDTAGRTMMGLTSAGMAALVAGLPWPPLAFG